MKRKLILTVTFYLVVGLLGPSLQNQLVVGDEIDVLHKTTLTQSIDGISLTLVYYEDLAVTGLPVTFAVSAINDTTGEPVWHIDPDVTISHDGTVLAFFHGHSHQGVFNLEYTFDHSGSHDVEVDIFTTGDTVLWNPSQVFGERKTTFTVNISDRSLNPLKIGPAVYELEGIKAQFVPSVDGVEVTNPSTDELVELLFTITFTNGTGLKHVTGQVIVTDPDGQLVIGSDQIHSHTGNLNMKTRFTKTGIHQIVVYLTPTAPGMRTQIDYGRQVAIFGLQVGETDSSDSPGFGIIITLSGFAILAIFTARKRNVI
ncbi:MAG: Heimdall-CTERM domain-containing surface protein [Candidatus Kariarchaeaceae archaeon]|jgi:hypothetical protein